MSEVSTQSKPKADVIHDKRMAQRIANVVITRAKEKGASNAFYITGPLGYVPELDALVAMAIKTYKAHSKRKFNL